MLVAETYIKESHGKGIGLYSKIFIAKGSKWWVRDENFDKVTSQEILETYDVLAQEFIKTYGFLEPTGNWYLCIDNSRFSNHSDFPNSKNEVNEKGEIISSIATKDIFPHQEILCDYRETCLACISNLGFENNE